MAIARLAGESTGSKKSDPNRSKRIRTARDIRLSTPHTIPARNHSPTVRCTRKRYSRKVIRTREVHAPGASHPARLHVVLNEVRP